MIARLGTWDKLLLQHLLLLAPPKGLHCTVFEMLYNLGATKTTIFVTRSAKRGLIVFLSLTNHNYS